MAADSRTRRLKCVIHYPTLKALLYAVKKLKMLYPEDEVRVAAETALEDAIAAAKFAASFTKGSCREKKLAAAATLFYEIIARHPLVDGNKRLATVILTAFMYKNALKTPPPGSVWVAAIRVAAGEWGPWEVRRWLERLQRSR